MECVFFVDAVVIGYSDGFLYTSLVLRCRAWGAALQQCVLDLNPSTCCAGTVPMYCWSVLSLAGVEHGFRCKSRSIYRNKYVSYLSICSAAAVCTRVISLVGRVFGSLCLDDAYSIRCRRSSGIDFRLCGSSLNRRQGGERRQAVCLLRRGSLTAHFERVLSKNGSFCGGVGFGVRGVRRSDVCCVW